MNRSKVLVTVAVGMALAVSAIQLSFAANSGAGKSDPPPVVTNQSKDPVVLDQGGAIAGPFDGEIKKLNEMGGIPLPAGAARLSISNVYMGRAGNNYVDLYAGSLSTDNNTGALWVDVSDPAGNSPMYPGGRIELPGSGPLSLQSVHGVNIVLTDATGTSHRYNLVTQRMS